MWPRVPGQAKTALTRQEHRQKSGILRKYEKATLETQEHFDQMMNDLFLDEVDNSLITLHYTLADPAPSASLTMIKPWGPFPWRIRNRL